MSKHVLIIDDESATLRAYKKLLETPNVHIDTAETIEEAAKSLASGHYEVVISDLRLTGTSNYEGFTILKYVKQSKLKTKVILVTAYGNSEIREKALNLGVSFYLEKPVLADDLRRAISSLGVRI